MIRLYIIVLKNALKHCFWRKIISCFILLLPLYFLPSANAQSCGCTNCPGVVAPATSMDFTFEVMGAANDDLSNATQGVCGVLLDIKPEHFWSTQFTLTSPNGQQVVLIGPPRLDLLIGYSAVGPWNISFLPCGDPVEPDPLFPDQWDNDFFDFGIVGGNYSGSYYPYSGCLQDFNSGTVNGTWTLSVQNVSGFYEAEVDFFQVVFCDETGLDCNPCDADAGMIANNVVIDACPNDTILNLDLPPSYTNAIPDTNLYGYTYIVSYNGIIEEYNPAPNLMGWNAGTYLICGLSYSYADTLKIPQPNGSLTRVHLEAALQNLNPIFCGDITDDCVIVNILPPDTLTVDAFLCDGDSFDYLGETYDTAGVYVLDISSLNGCDTTIIINLTGIDSIRTTIDTTICNGDIIGVGNQIYNTTGNYVDTLTSYRNCDSIIYLNLQVRDSILIYIEKAICIGDSCVIGNNVYNSNGIFVNTFNALNGCDSFVILDLKILDPDAFIAQADLLNCSNSPITLDGSGSSTGASIVYQWLHLDNGGDGIVSGANTSTPQVNKFGEYQLNLTDTLRGASCTVSSSVLVFGDLDPPTAQAIADSITCGNPTASLFGVSLTAGVSYQWIGPSGFYATTKDTISDIPGFYTFIVTGGNGCQDSVVVEVKKNVESPIAQIIGDTVDCATPQVLLEGSSSIGVQLSYDWRNGSGSYLNNTSSILASIPDNYALIVQNANNACKDTTYFELIEDLAIPNITVQADTLTCTNPIAALTGNSSTPGVSYQWNGPSGFVAYAKDTITNIPGLYTLRVTGQNACTATESITVILDQDPPSISTNSELITCANPIAALNANATMNGMQYHWTGPLSFEAFSKDTFTNEPGLYQLTVTGTNGCTTMVDEIVVADIDIPNISANADTITCSQLVAGLYGNSTTSNVSYNWIGSAGFESQMADTVTNTPGAYQLTVTANNGCTASTQVLVILDQHQPNISASADTITCAVLEASLNGSSTTENVSYTWTGPAGFNASMEDTTTTVSGSYQLMVTAENGCTNTFNVEVPLDQDIPNINASVGTISCTDATANLNGSSSTPNVSYYWSGPAAYQSTNPDTLTNIPGLYQFTVTAANACTAQMELEVAADQDIPELSAAADTIDCLITTANLTSTSNTNNLNYFWTGPAGFTAFSADTISNIPGLYQLTVIAPNGCNANTQVELVENIVLPDISAFADTLNCIVEEATLNGNSTNLGVSYLWTGPAGFTSTSADTLTTIPGIYELQVTGENACVASVELIVILDETIPDISASADSITCGNATAALTGNSTTNNVSYIWTGPAGFYAEIADTSTSLAGVYQLQVTGENACTATTEVEVFIDQSLPVITAQADSINCLNEPANLQVSSSETGLSYQWTGPSGFSAFQADTITSINGMYQVVATAENGCTVTADVEVFLDTQTPDLILTADTINCENLNAQLNSESTESGLSYQWTGPAGFTAQVEDTLTNVAGVYQLIATAPNACTTSLEIEVVEDVEIPNISAAADSIDCSASTANLMGSSTTPNVTYQWIGPAGFESQMADTITSIAGVYQLSITATNGCAATQQVLVIEDENIPDVFASADSITCATGSATLIGNSSTSNVSYVWTGPNGFYAEIADTSTTVAGVYELQVTAENACTATMEVEVFIDQDVPQVTAQAGNINCLNETATLEVDAIGIGLSYLWTGPAGFSAFQADTITAISGMYQVLVTAENGCSITTEVEVSLDTQTPSLSLIADTLNCLTQVAQLNSESTTENLNYQWTGPSGFMAQSEDTLTNIAGVYELLATAQNGCTTIQEIEVLENIEIPTISATADSIGCNSSTANLIGNSTTPNVIYNWTGPAGFESQMSDTITSVGGVYLLQVTAQNGCSATQQVLVFEDQNVPDVLAEADSITCSNPEAMLFGSSSISGLDYQWTGPSGFLSESQDTSTTIAGTYLLKVTTPSGCTATSELTVVENIDLPTISATADSISCTNSTANLIGNSNTENVNYEWTGPGGFIAYSKDTITNAPGLYELKVIAPNGCTVSTSVEVVSDQGVPDISIAADTINCLFSTANLIGNSTTANVSYEWMGPAGFMATQKDTSTTIPGIYQLTISASNSCSVVGQVEVIEDLLNPTVSIDVDTIDCATSVVDLIADSADQGLVYEWTGPMGFLATVKDTFTTIIGSYNLLATAENACTTDIAFEVVSDLEIPDVSGTADTITCTQNAASLIGNSTTTNVSYEWMGPAGFMATQKDTSTTIPGIYELTVTASNACTQMLELTVISDQDLPNITASVDSISCTSTIANLSGNSTTEGVSYSWTGPGGFSAMIPDTTTNVAGLYEFTVTSPNACTASIALEVVADQDIPQVNALADTINCLVEEANLNGNSTTLGVSYQWSGPNGFSSENADTTTTIPGLYQLVVTAANACSATAQVEVIDDQDLPNISATNDNINCLQAEAQLLGNSTNNDVSYEWSGPAGFVAYGKDTITNLAGVYTLKVASANGCSNSITLEVSEDLEEPIITAANIAILDCSSSMSNMTASSSTPDVNYEWTGPNGFVAFVADTMSNIPGFYQLTLTGANACTATMEIELIEDVAIPEISASADSINCNQLVANLNGSSATPNVSYEWTGPNGFMAFSADTMSNLPGLYQLVVTAANSCTAALELTVIEDLEEPNISATANNINCNQLIANLSGNSTTPNVSYEWVGPNNFSVNDWNAQTMMAGTYQFLVTADNGCTATEEFNIVVDTLSPIAVANISGNLNCAQILTILDGGASSTGPDLTYEWQTEEGVFLTEELILETSENGLYQFIVLDIDNFCKDTAFVELNIDTLDLEQAPIAEDDFFEMNNVTSLSLDLSENDLFNQVSEWDLQIINSPDLGDLQLLGPGLYEFSISDYTGTVYFEYEICNDICPDLCDTASVEIQVEYQILNDTTLDIPSGFTPNGDGKNDVFIIPELELDPDKYPKNELLIFNRWGDVVFQASPYNNDWDGKSKDGKELPHGTYYYILRLDLSQGKIFQGDVTILR